MIRISKLTDYAMVILAHMGKNPTLVLQTSEIANELNLTKPTVAKILKQLVNKNILISQRGATGGYQLANNTEELSLATIITALEGQVAITQCNSTTKHCARAAMCPINSPWVKINHIIYESLAAYKLSDLITCQLPEKSGLAKKSTRTSHDY